VGVPPPPEGAARLLSYEIVLPAREALDAVVERVRGLDGVSNVGLEARDQKQVLVVQTMPGRELMHMILGHLDGSEVGRVSSREPTLEDAYVALVDE
jgi:ABC-2 type transport system ATP-binding protein